MDNNSNNNQVIIEKKKPNIVVQGIKGLFDAVYKVVALVLDACFLIVIVYGLLYAPQVMGYKQYVIESENELSYQKGTLIYYKSVPATDIHENDVIIYKPEKKFILHKVYEVKTSDLLNLEKENNNNESDTTNNTTTTNETTTTKDNNTSTSTSEDTTLKTYYYETASDEYSKTEPNLIEYKKVYGKVLPINIPFAGYYTNLVNKYIKIFYILVGVVVVDFLFSLVKPTRRK